jgi:hypothetical protein
MFREAKQSLLRDGLLIFDHTPSDLIQPLIDGLEKELGEGKFRFDYDKLNEKFVGFIPSPIHNSIQGAFHDILLDMIETGFLSWTQYRGLVPYVGMRYDAFIGAYAGQVKEADYALVIDGRATPGVPSHCPILVHECGYSESSPSLLRDITKWLHGTGPDGVITAISAKFYKRKNRKLAGGLKIYADGGNKIVSRTIFPPPEDPVDNKVALTRRELFSDVIPLEDGQTPQDIFILDVCHFEKRAREYAGLMSLTPL